MKKFLSLFVLVSIVSVMMLLLASCELDFGASDNTHEHKYGNTWSSNETHHWRAAICAENDSCAAAKSLYAEHTFEWGVCKVCNANRTHTHTYDDGCDTECNGCGEKRTAEHIYDNSCDPECNNCFAARRASHKPEADDFDCTTSTYCSVCRDVIKEGDFSHSFTTNCDTSCNTDGCNHTRKTEHTYTDVCDTDCNGCGYKRSAPHSYGNSNICGKCSYGAMSNPKAITLPSELLFTYVPNTNADPIWYTFTTTSEVKIALTLGQNTVMDYGIDKTNMTTANSGSEPLEFTLEKETTYYMTFVTSNGTSGDVSAAVKCYKPGTDTEWPLYGKEIVNLGDSIFGTHIDNTSLSYKLHLASGATTYNCGFGGTRMHTRPWDAPHRYFDMRTLIDAIISKNFTEQEKTFVPDEEGKLFDGRFPTLLDTLKSIDFTDQVVTLNHGTNDWTGETKIEDYKDSLRYVINTIQENYPNVRIVLLSPTWRCTFENGEYVPGGNDTAVNATTGKTNYDYVLAMKDIADEIGVDFIDCYNIGINAENCLNYFNGKDGTHHDERGRAYLADHITKELAKILGQ